MQVATARLSLRATGGGGLLKILMAIDKGLVLTPTVANIRKACDVLFSKVSLALRQR